MPNLLLKLICGVGGSGSSSGECEDGCEKKTNVIPLPYFCEERLVSGLATNLPLSILVLSHSYGSTMTPQAWINAVGLSILPPGRRDPTSHLSNLCLLPKTLEVRRGSPQELIPQSHVSLMTKPLKLAQEAQEASKDKNKQKTQQCLLS